MKTIEMVKSPVVLIGPTTAGKSEVAAAMSDMTGGTIITADRGYMYADPDLFWLGLGLLPNELNDGRPRRLFGSLRPLDQPLEPTDYISRVQSEVDLIHSVGGVAIIEGCTRRYNRALLGQFGVDHAVGISWPSAANVHHKLTRRVQLAIDHGMIDEVEAALAAGYGDAHPMTTVPYRHSINVINGRESVSEAEAAIADELAQISVDHMSSYAAIDGLGWYVHERGRTNQVAMTALTPLSTRGYMYGGSEPGLDAWHPALATMQ